MLVVNLVVTSVVDTVVEVSKLVVVSISSITLSRSLNSVNNL